MKRLNLTAYVYLSIEHKQRFTVSRRFEFSKVNRMVEKIKTLWTVTTIGFSALAYGLAG